MLPHATHARQLVLKLGQLDLQLALRGMGVGGEDVEDQRRAVDDTDLEAVLEVALLGGRQLVVNHEHLGLDHGELLLKLIDLARAEVGLELGPVAALDQLPNWLALRRVEQFRQLGEIRLDALVWTSDGGHVRALERGAADLIEAVAH